MLVVGSERPKAATLQLTHSIEVADLFFSLDELLQYKLFDRAPVQCMRF